MAGATNEGNARIPQKKREPVLMVGHADGWVEVFAERHVDAHIAMMPFAATPEAQVMAEEYLESKLPRRYRELYWPGMKRAAELVQIVTPDDILYWEWKAEMFRAVEDSGRILREETKEGIRKLWIA